MNDLILKSSNIFASDGSSLFSGSLQIHDGRIIKISRNSETIDKHDGRFIDLGDRLIIPGFCDSHIHGFLGCLQMQSVDLTGCTSEAECVKKAAAFYSGNQGPGWLIGFGWNSYSWNDRKLPDRRSLDAVFGKRPVCFFNEEMHSAWVNSAALAAVGINRNTAEPNLGKIFHDENGDPNGYLLEPDAMRPVMDAAFRLEDSEREKLYRSLLKKAADLGITSLSDIDITGTLFPEIYEKIFETETSGCRVHLVFPMDTDIKLLKDYRNRYDTEYLRFSGVKEFLDGTAPMYTGLLVAPYADRPGFNAQPLVNVEKTIQQAIKLDKDGFRIRFHACGAGAARLGLNIFEAVRKQNGFNDTRHTIEHIENIHPDDIPRFRQLAVTASVQPDHLWADTYEGHPFHSLLGTERCRWAWPFKSLLDSGADIAFGTDFPVSPLNPMQGLYRAVSRLHEDGKPEGGWNPQEKLSVAEAITAYTAGSSRQMYNEDLTGMLKQGFAADITVVDGNLFEMSPDEIRKAGIYMTISGGKIIKELR